MYYQQPPQEPPSVAPNKREKKIINIIDPRTGINVISDLRSSSSAEWKSLTNEVRTCPLSDVVFYRYYVPTVYLRKRPDCYD